MISVVIPLYNKEKQIAKTLKTVLDQTFQDFEIVIVNDGSTDNSITEVEKFSDPRIRLIHQENAGVSAARNKGIAEAKGEYIALLDADDEWKPDYLETQMKLATKYPECEIFVTGYEFKNEFGELKRSVLRNMPFTTETGILSNYFHVASTSDAPIWTSAVMVERKLLQDIEGFPLGITSGEDLLTWARLAVRSKIAFCYSPKAIYYTPTTGPTGKVPVDLKSTNDTVGTELIKLANKYPDKGIEEYVSYWYKMRAAINIRRKDRFAAFKCAKKSLKFNPKNLKSRIIITLCIMPAFVIKKIMK